MGDAKLVYKLELPSDLCIHPVFHVSALKAYKNSEGGYKPPPLPALVDGYLEYEVDCVTNTHNEGNELEYRVHWVGYPVSTWENVKNLTNCQNKQAEFWDTKGMPCLHGIPFRPKARS